MIISLSGRKKSGKTTLAKEAINRGFIKISFADKLKKIISDVLSCPIDELYDQYLKEKKYNKPIYWKDIKIKLENILKIKTPNDLENKTLESHRDVLQFVGTEVLRKIDPEFHVNSLKEIIEPNKNYILDDTRFLNELNMLTRLGADCIFTIRPYYEEYSNHTSETELSRKYFERIILNNQSKDKMIEKFIRFLDNKDNLLNTISSRSGSTLSNFFLSETPESCYFCGILYSKSQIVFKNNCLLIQLSDRVEAEYPKDLFSIYENKFTIDNQIYLDDLKRWNILEKNKDKSFYPEILKDKADLQKFWFKGVNN